MNTRQVKGKRAAPALEAPGGSDSKESACNRRLRFNPWVRKIPWRRKWQPTPVFLPRKPLSLAGYSPWGCKRVGHDLVTKQRMGTQVVHIEEYKDTVYICSVCGWREYLTTCVSVFAHVHP